MAILNVPDMHCGMCVSRIEAAFAQASIPCTVTLESRTVAVDDGQVELAISELDDLGFDASV